MAFDPLRCDDPIAERRFLYARAAARERDWTATADVLEQTVEIAPRWAAAWFALGEARQQLGDFFRARAAFAEALRLDPDDAHGASLRLATLDGVPPTALPAAYVARLFDDYAPRFNAHLTVELNYRGPELIAAAIEAAAPGRRFRRAVDLGCGSGLAGAPLRGCIDTLIGVDLSPGMIAEARRTGLYDALLVGDFVAFLVAGAEEDFDLVVAADAFVYLGDLAPALAAIRAALTSDGLVVLSLESESGRVFIFPRRCASAIRAPISSARSPRRVGRGFAHRSLEAPGGRARRARAYRGCPPPLGRCDGMKGGRGYAVGLHGLGAPFPRFVMRRAVGFPRTGPDRPLGRKV